MNYSNTSGSGVVYAETVGVFALTNGQTNVRLSSSMFDGNGNMQTLNIGGLSQANAATVSFLGPSLNATTDLIQVPNATQTAAGQVIAPWAATGLSTASLFDYAVYEPRAEFCLRILALPRRTPGRWRTTATRSVAGPH